jgi:carbonic anhydrase
MSSNTPNQTNSAPNQNQNQNQNQTNSPVDINASAVEGTCQQKCQLLCRYKECPGVVRIEADHLSISHEVLPEAPVEFNGFQFQVSEVRVYIPSIHTFNGSPTAAEIIIVHYSAQGGTPMYICVPVIANDAASPSSSYLAAVGSVLSSLQPNPPPPTTTTSNGGTTSAKTGSKGPNNNINTSVLAVAAAVSFVGESTTLPSPLDLSIFVPNAAFYQYRGTQLFTPYQGDVDYVVFSPDDAHADIRREDFAVLAQVVAKHTYVVHKGPTLFRNNVGMIQRHMDDQIYIDCQPVGASEDTTLAYSIGTNGTDQDSKSYDFGKSLATFFATPFVQALLAGIVFVLIMIILLYGYGKLNGRTGQSDVKWPNLFGKSSSSGSTGSAN